MHCSCRRIYAFLPAGMRTPARSEHLRLPGGAAGAMSTQLRGALMRCGAWCLHLLQGCSGVLQGSGSLQLWLNLLPLALCPEPGGGTAAPSDVCVGGARANGLRSSARGGGRCAIEVHHAAHVRSGAGKGPVEEPPPSLNLCSSRPGRQIHAAGRSLRGIRALSDAS